MEDKLAKVRAEIERQYNEYITKDSELAAIRADECLGILSLIDSMQEEPTIPDIVDKHFDEILGEESVSEDLEEAAKHYLYSNILYDDVYVGNPTDKDCIEMFKAGAKWQKEHLWKPADGDDLPEIDREVIALLDNGKVVFAHRPPEYWDGKDIVTGKVTRNYPKTYDKCGWNIPNIKYWLDVELPKEIEP